MTRRGLAVLPAIALVAACGPGPKPAGLLTFEELRKQPAVQSMKEAAPTIWKDSDAYYRLAFEAWEDGDDEESKEYALLGTILYETASQMAEVAGMEAEMAAFQEQLEEGRKIRDDWAAKKEVKEQAVSALMGELQSANKLVVLEERRQTEQAALKDQMASEKRMADVRQRHAELLLRLQETEKVDAARHAAGEYNRAKNLLNKAGYEIEDDDAMKARETLEEAATAIATALDIARPIYEASSKKEHREEQNQALIAKAHSLGVDGVRVEPRGAVVILGGLFGAKGTTIQPGKRLLLDKVGALMLEYADYRVVIEGHTSDKGKDEANLTLSQAWANAVAGHFVSKGIGMERLAAVGLGETQPLEDNRTAAGQKRNTRVEVVFLFPRP